jgi:hypothetical protein
MSLLAVPTVSSDSTISDIDTIDPCNSFSYQEAVLGCDSVFWFTAMQIEMSCMETNHTLTLTSLPPDHVAIKVRWMYKVKRYIDGSIKRRRARLLVKGFTQRPGIDFTETSYAPVPMILFNFSNMILFKLFLLLLPSTISIYFNLMLHPPIFRAHL